MAEATSHLRYDDDDGRGREAARPTQVPARGWKDVAVRVKSQMKTDDVPLLAAGVAFFALLALVPTLAALVSLYGLVADPAEIQRNIEDVLAAAPQEVRDLVTSQLHALVDSSPSGLKIGAIAGLVVALWSASSGVKHLIGAINLAYDEEETRGFVKLRGLSLIMTVVGIAVMALAVAGLVVLPHALDDQGTVGVARALLMVVRWPVFAVLGLVGLALIYRYAPDRDAPRWQWVSPGAVFAVVVWVIASILFSLYTANFGQYNETYGALGAVVVVMLWLYITAYVVITGAEINAELERQTAKDTTVGRRRRMGERNAYAADTLGEAPARR
jgi:membrane protein